MLSPHSRTTRPANDADAIRRARIERDYRIRWNQYTQTLQMVKDGFTETGKALARYFV